MIVTDNSAFGEIFADATADGDPARHGRGRSLAVATRAWDLGITAVEVPVQSTADVEALRVVADAARERGLIVGAGTVVTVEQVRVAKDAGAAFTVSPGFDVEVVRGSHEAGLPALPGVATATEAQHALGEGLTWLKAFPAGVLGHGLVPGDARAVPTGAVRRDRWHGPRPTHAAFLDAGARVARRRLGARGPRRSCPRWRRRSSLSPGVHAPPESWVACCHDRPRPARDAPPQPPRSRRAATSWCASRRRARMTGS